MYEIKTKVVYFSSFYQHFSSNKEKFDFSNYLPKSKYYDNLSKLFIGKEFVGLKPKLYLFLVDNSEHKKKA